MQFWMQQLSVFVTLSRSRVEDLIHNVRHIAQPVGGGHMVALQAPSIRGRAPGAQQCPLAWHLAPLFLAVVRIALIIYQTEK